MSLLTSCGAEYIYLLSSCKFLGLLVELLVGLLAPLTLAGDDLLLGSYLLPSTLSVGPLRPYPLGPEA